MRVPDTIAGYLASEALVQNIVDSLRDGERRLLGGIPDTPYLLDDEYDDIAARFLSIAGSPQSPAAIPLDTLRDIADDTPDAADGFLDLYRAGGGTYSITVAVRPTARGTGTATRLVEEAQEWLWRSGGVQLNWFAKRENEISIALAVRCRFQERDDYRDDPEWWGGAWSCE